MQNKILVKKIKRPKKITKKVVMVSGAFDPVHVGHVRMFNEAKKLGDKLIVLLNNDNWLQLKKGYVFMPENERREILESFAAIDEVILSSHKKGTKDISIIDDLKKIRPHIFAKGGDRHAGNIPETPVCEEIGCMVVNDIGFGGKVQSSSWLVERKKTIKIYPDYQKTKKIKK